MNYIFLNLFSFVFITVEKGQEKYKKNKFSFFKQVYIIF